jgi:hypothetical protein
MTRQGNLSVRAGHRHAAAESTCDGVTGAASFTVSGDMFWQQPFDDDAFQAGCRAQWGAKTPRTRPAPSTHSQTLGAGRLSGEAAVARSEPFSAMGSSTRGLAAASLKTPRLETAAAAAAFLLPSYPDAGHTQGITSSASCGQTKRTGRRSRLWGHVDTADECWRLI